MTTDPVHIPVLLQSVLEFLLEPFRESEGWCIDCTFGGGGHTGEILKARPGIRVLAIDQDPGAIAAGQKNFAKEIADGRLKLVHGRMSQLPEIAAREIGARTDGPDGVPESGALPVLAILADLGISSDQLDDPARGLSFKSDGALDMRLDPTREWDCGDYLASLPEEELAAALSEGGEPRFARRIATAIVDARHQKKLPKTPAELSDLIVFAIPRKFRHGRIHAATKSFQALRILVNREMEELDALLGDAILLLSPHGRLGVISFHSGEDRKVKHAFKEKSKASFRLLTKKPVVPDDMEISQNSRARSAKFRVIERTAGTKDGDFAVYAGAKKKFSK